MIGGTIMIRGPFTFLKYKLALEVHLFPLRVECAHLVSEGDGSPVFGAKSVHEHDVQ